MAPLLIFPFGSYSGRLTSGNYLIPGGTYPTPLTIMTSNFTDPTTSWAISIDWTPDQWGKDGWATVLTIPAVSGQGIWTTISGPTTNPIFTPNTPLSLDQDGCIRANLTANGTVTLAVLFNTGGTGA